VVWALIGIPELEPMAPAQQALELSDSGVGAGQRDIRAGRLSATGARRLVPGPRWHRARHCLQRRRGRGRGSRANARYLKERCIDRGKPGRAAGEGFYEYDTVAARS
jgi:hypothetical protein